jgi:hypothetical protein
MYLFFFLATLNKLKCFLKGFIFFFPKMDDEQFIPCISEKKNTFKMSNTNGIKFKVFFFFFQISLYILLD